MKLKKKIFSLKKKTFFWKTNKFFLVGQFVWVSRVTANRNFFMVGRRLAFVCLRFPEPITKLWACQTRSLNLSHRSWADLRPSEQVPKTKSSGTDKVGI